MLRMRRFPSLELIDSLTSPETTMKIPVDADFSEKSWIPG